MVQKIITNNYNKKEMKQLKVLYLLAIILLCGIMLSCEKTGTGEGDDDNGSSTSGGNNNLKTGQIEIKVYPDGKNKVEFYITAKKVTIDWGDGSVDELTPNGVYKNFTHEYPNQNLRTVKVNTEEMNGEIHTYEWSGYNYTYANPLGFSCGGGIISTSFEPFQIFV